MKLVMLNYGDGKFTAGLKFNSGHSLHKIFIKRIAFDYGEGTELQTQYSSNFIFV